ncbi:MAG: hypothetical protein CSA49_04720 [Gammaproteobacteria bacterium]|nr:MAG: hypothetical protein CSA49_04720 [Gammaproteobacteria bacterium]
MYSSSCMPAAMTKQKGAVLVLALILLTVLTFVGVSSNRDVILQERMAANELDSSVSLQAAEAMVRVAEANFGACEPSSTQSTSGSTNGWYSAVTNHGNPAPDWEFAAKLADGDNAWITETFSHVAQNPRYMIERMQPFSYNKHEQLDLEIAPKYAVPYRIVAQGFGTSTKADSVIQTIQYTYDCN